MHYMHYMHIHKHTHTLMHYMHYIHIHYMHYIHIHYMHYAHDLFFINTTTYTISLVVVERCWANTGATDINPGD